MVNPVFKVVYDNYKVENDMKTAHGFSCFIESDNKNILFDTGSDGDILLSNMKKMNISPESVDIIVLSHNHWDHVDGLPAVLEQNNKVKVYILRSFGGSVRENIGKHNLFCVEVDKPLEILKDVYSTGEMGIAVREQSLIFDTDRGLVIITGCAHQGIIKAVERSKEILNRKIHLVFGGFHLVDKSEGDISGIIEGFKMLGVNFVGPSHCTGEVGIKMFADAYQSRFIKVGAGKVISIDSLS